MHYWPSGLCEYIRAAEQIEFHAQDDHFVKKKKAWACPREFFTYRCQMIILFNLFISISRKYTCHLSVDDSVWFTSANANAVSDYNLLFSSGP